MFTAVAILLVFLLIAGLMMAGKLPTVIALPILAVAIAFIAGVPFSGENGIMTTVFDDGAAKMVNAMVALMLGAWLGQLMNHTGVSKTIIRTAAELGGDRPFLVTILLAAASTVIYTTVSGLGGVIMVATITLPIMLSVGVPAVTAVIVFLFSYAGGLAINLTNWAYFTSVTGVELETVKPFAYTMLGLTAAATLLYTVVAFKRQGLKFAWAAPSQAPADEVFDADFQKAPVAALFTPLVPLVLVMGFKWSINTAFVVGMLYCFLTVWLLSKDRRRNLSRLVGLTTRSGIDGMNDSAIAILIFVGIGMLSGSLTNPVVSEAIKDPLAAVVPSSPWGYLAFFALLAPLALYRGPMNIWGLGGGVASLIVSLNILPAPAVMTAFTSAERVQVLADPTNTHSVWLANYAGTDVMTILKKILPWAWALAVIGVGVSTFLWF